MSNLNLITKIFIFPVIFFILSVTLPSDTQAAKKFIPKGKTVRYTTSSGSIPAVVRYRPDRLGILMSFSNFAGIESVAYSFTYTTNGIPQGAGGTVTAGNNPTSSRELLFGTCSTSVCTYHYNLSGARLVVTAKLTNGRTVTKGYRIKTYR